MRKNIEDEIIEQEVRRDKYQLMQQPKVMPVIPQRVHMEEEKKGPLQFVINQSA
jgi:hypothetical protein